MCALPDPLAQISVEYLAKRHRLKWHPVSSGSFVPVRPSAAIVAAICAAEILSLAGFSIVPALLPQFIEAWSLTNTQAGWLAGIVSAGYMLAVIPLVSLTDRRPARQLYLASTALSPHFSNRIGASGPWI